jgi:fatty acid synthase
MAPPIRGHLFRGYSVAEHEITVVEEVIQKPTSDLWFVFNGMGSQWEGMGKDLLQIQVFAQTIQRLSESLRSRFGYDLMANLDKPDGQDPLSCFVTIAAIQIGLLDVLTSLDIIPDWFIGHSAGEMVCAYADGCLTAEEAIAVAYLRGSSLTEVKSGVEYGMGVVGASWADVTNECPPGIYPACHNGSDSVTVSGPTELLDPFLANMQKKYGFAKTLDSCGVAFHSPYVEGASKTFLESLSDIIKDPVARSSKWISTSIPKEKEGEKLALKASPEHFVNNFRSPVLFYDALKQIPEGATVVEIGPSGLFAGLIRKGTIGATVITLQKRASENGLLDFISAIGRMFIAGIRLDVNKLGESEEYPVPLGTPMISPLIQWDHSFSWDVPRYGQNGEFMEGIFEVDTQTDRDSYLIGHCIEGRILFPATGYLVLVWKFFAQKQQADFMSCPVIFEDIKFHRITILHEFGLNYILLSMLR